MAAYRRVSPDLEAAQQRRRRTARPQDEEADYSREDRVLCFLGEWLVPLVVWAGAAVVLDEFGFFGALWRGGGGRSYWHAAPEGGAVDQQLLLAAVAVSSVALCTKLYMEACLGEDRLEYESARASTHALLLASLASSALLWMALWPHYGLVTPLVVACWGVVLFGVVAALPQTVGNVVLVGTWAGFCGGKYGYGPY